MDKTSLVEKQIQEGKIFLTELDKQNLQIKAAFWMYDENDSSWKFVISSASEKLNVKINILEAYSTLTEILRTLELTALSASDVLLLPLDNPLIQSFGRLFQTGKGIVNISFSKTLLNDVFVEGLFLYRMNIK